MNKKRLALIVLLISTSLCLISCFEKNPIGPVIRQTWGDYDYFGYCIYTNWEYQENHPHSNTLYEIRYNIFGQEFRNPRTGWQRLLVIDDELIGYYLISIDRNGLYYYNFSRNIWHLHYELPLIIGNKWSLNYTYDEDLETMVRVNINREVLERKDQTVMGVEYEDCMRIKKAVHVQYFKSDTLDSSYYYVLEEWLAPNTGMVKWIITSTDVDEWVQASCYLERKYGEKYIWPYGQVQPAYIELPPHLHKIPGIFKKIQPQN